VGDVRAGVWGGARAWGRRLQDQASKLSRSSAVVKHPAPLSGAPGGAARCNLPRQRLGSRVRICLPWAARTGRRPRRISAARFENVTPRGPVPVNTAGNARCGSGSRTALRWRVTSGCRATGSAPFRAAGSGDRTCLGSLGVDRDVAGCAPPVGPPGRRCWPERGQGRWCAGPETGDLRRMGRLPVELRERIGGISPAGPTGNVSSDVAGR
jgi:hypothetical protein